MNSDSHIKKLEDEANKEHQKYLAEHHDEIVQMKEKIKQQESLLALIKTLSKLNWFKHYLHTIDQVIKNCKLNSMDRFVEETNFTKDLKKCYINVHKVDQMNGLEPFRVMIKK